MKAYARGVGLTLALSVCLHADQSATRGGYSELQAQSAVTPLAGPVIHNWAEFTVSADFIYWQVREDYLHFAMDGDRGPIYPDAQGQIYDLNFQYAPGLRAAVGLDFKHDGWDSIMGYTWLRQDHITGSVESTEKNGYLDDIAMRHFTKWQGDNVVNADWQIHFNAVDWVLGRHFYISRYLALRPFMGVKGAWINQKFKCEGWATAKTVNDSLNETTQSQQFWGVGARGGTDLEWHFTRNWSFYGNFAFDLLYGQFQDTVLIRQRDMDRVPHDVVKQSQQCNLHTISPILEMALGVRYETFFSQDRYQLYCQAGWDQQVWFDQNRFLVGLASGAGQIGGNLVLQGLDVQFGFSF